MPADARFTSRPFHAGDEEQILALFARAFPHATERAYRWVADHRDVVARLLRIDASCNIRR